MKNCQRCKEGKATETLHLLGKDGKVELCKKCFRLAVRIFPKGMEAYYKFLKECGK